MTTVGSARSGSAAGSNYRHGMQLRWSWRRSAAALIIGLGAVGFGAQGAFAHAALEGSDPAPGAILPSAPAAITLTFTEPVEAKLGAVKVYDTVERRVDEGRVTTDGAVVRAPLQTGAMRTGTYVVVWRVVSIDGHPVQGAFTFSVGAPSTDAGAAESLANRFLARSGASTAVGVVALIGRTLAFTGLALFIGAALAGVVWARPLLTSRTMTRVVWTGLLLTAVGTVVALLAQGSYAAGLGLGQVLRVDLLGDVLQTRFGRALAVRIGLVVLAFFWWRWTRRSGATRVAVVVGAVLALAIATTVSLAGHAATGSMPVVGVVLDIVHVLATNAWFGGLVVLAFAVLVSEPVPWSAVQRFSSIALIAVICLVLSGSAQGWRQLGSLSALTETDYGRVLIAKIVIFICVLPLAAYGRDLLRRRITEADLAAARDDPEAQADLEGGLEDVEVRRRLSRSVYVEVAFLVVVLFLTAVLVNTVPGRELEAQPVTVRMADPKVRIVGTIAPARLGPNEVHLTATSPDGLPLETQGMTAQFIQPGIGALDVPLRRLTPGHYYAPRFVIPRTGTWTLVVRTNIDAFTQVVQEQEVRIR